MRFILFPDLILLHCKCNKVEFWSGNKTNEGAHGDDGSETVRYWRRLERSLRVMWKVKACKFKHFV